MFVTMRKLVALVAGMLVLALLGFVLAPSSERADRLVAEREAALRQHTLLRAMTNEFINLAYPDDTVLYCWARSANCAAQTQGWIADVKDLRTQFRDVVVGEFPHLEPTVSVAEFRLDKRLAEIRALYVAGPPDDRRQAYNAAREAASDAFVLYRNLPGDPSFVFTDLVLALHRMKRAIGIE